MKKIAITAVLLLAALPWHAAAQVEKQVEVTKAYVPRVESASKLAVAPDMTDTVKMRPEIDYTITPLSLQRAFATRPIRPATVTYWEFNRPQPFYLKVGAGYPLNSEVDFYASTQHPGTGYLLGYVNHEGRYADIRNDFGVKNNSARMTNRAGVAAGKYFGRHTLEADLWYDNRLYHRYGAWSSPESPFEAAGAKADYGRAQAEVRFGDDFRDLSRVNFEVVLRGGLFFDHSQFDEFVGRAGQSDWAVRARIAKGFGRHSLGAELGYDRFAGSKDVKELYGEQLLRAGLRYGLDGGVVHLEAGADYFHDKLRAAGSGDYVIPFLRLGFDLGSESLRPFVELDGDVRPNDCYTLSLENPYLLPVYLPERSSVSYDGRIGIGGSLRSGVFAYRVSVGFSIRDNRVYWLGLPDNGGISQGTLLFSGYFRPVQARQTVLSFDGEAEYRPVSALCLSLGLHGYLYNDEGCAALTGAPVLENGLPSFEGDFGLRYEGRRIMFGVGVALRGKCGWSLLNGIALEGDPLSRTVDTPFAADLRALLEWKVSGRTAIFAEGRNLAGSKLYEYGWYRGYGANFTAGVKLNF